MDCFASLAMTRAMLRHRLGEVFRDLVEEARGREPALIGTDKERKILGHEPGFDGVDADLFERGGEFCEFGVVVELGAMGEATRPGKDRSDRVGRSLLALLMFAVMPRYGAVRGFRFD